MLLPPRTLLPLGYPVLKGSPHYIWFCCTLTHPFSLLLTTNPQDSSVGKKRTSKAEDTSLIPGSGIFPGEGIGYLL